MTPCIIYEEYRLSKWDKLVTRIEGGKMTREQAQIFSRALAERGNQYEPVLRIPSFKK